MMARTLMLKSTLALATLLASSAFASGRFGQLVFTFGDKRPYRAHYEASDASLVLELAKTSPQELTALDHYDERLIRRVVVKDLGPLGTEVRLVLRDAQVRTAVNAFDEPFRITVDLFDRGYHDVKDPLTGLPVEPADLGQGPRQLANSDEALSSEPNEGSLASVPRGVSHPPADRPRRLLQPLPELFKNPEDMERGLKQVDSGPGKAWHTYPIYIYRLETAPYEAGMARRVQTASQALSSADAMAAFASNLYNEGDETRALVAYQQVLQTAPQVFENEPLHLWKLAEAHLGQGNLMLADGYYQALAEKHPESPLARFAALRRLDISAIRAAKEGKDASALVPSLANLSQGANPELRALAAIRRAFWQTKTSSSEPIPTIDGTVRSELAASLNAGIESHWTGYLGSSLLLADALRPEVPWQEDIGNKAQAYISRYAGPAYALFREPISQRLEERLNTTIQEAAAKGQAVDAIDTYEKLPASLQSLSGQLKTTWALGDSYRLIGRPDKATVFYRKAAQKSEGSERLRALVWLELTASEAAGRKGHSSMRHLAVLADRAAGKEWQKIAVSDATEKDREELFVALREPLEKALSSAVILKTPPLILLDRLSSQKNVLAPSASVDLLLGLGRRLAKAGLSQKAREAKSLLAKVDPKSFKTDEERRQWANALDGIAEERRKANDYLEAGRMFALAGSENPNWDGRAESLYKGGLLLYRAGSRAEAIDAFKKASEDGNNLFYANLAKERLNQLQK